MTAFGGDTDIVSCTGALVMSDDVTHQMGGVAAAAATRHLGVVGLAMLVISFPGRVLIEVGRIGFAAACHGDVQQCAGGVFAEDRMGGVSGDALGGVHG